MYPVTLEKDQTSSTDFVEGNSVMAFTLPSHVVIPLSSITSFINFKFVLRNLHLHNLSLACSHVRRTNFNFSRSCLTLPNITRMSPKYIISVLFESLKIYVHQKSKSDGRVSVQTASLRIDNDFRGMKMWSWTYFF